MMKDLDTAAVTSDLDKAYQLDAIAKKKASKALNLPVALSRSQCIDLISVVGFYSRVGQTSTMTSVRN